MKSLRALAAKMIKKRRWRGHVDSFSHSIIVGWVYDPSDPKRALTIEATTTTGKRLKAVANLHRGDLLDSEIGTGRYGFEVDLTPWNQTEGMITLRIAGSDDVIAVGPFPSTAPTALGSDLKGPGLINWVGCIDHVSSVSIKGWACDTERLESGVILEAIASNGRRTLAFANIFRDDLMRAGYGNGKHGFEIDIRPLRLIVGVIKVQFLDSGVLIASIEIDPAILSLASVSPLYQTSMRALLLEARLYFLSLHDNKEEFR